MAVKFEKYSWIFKDVRLRRYVPVATFLVREIANMVDETHRENRKITRADIFNIAIGLAPVIEGAIRDVVDITPDDEDEPEVINR